ncbi:hypothetical protein GGP41_008386 [Bipolaris sorokiniana]|uniref:Uncharacterized protein n=1 Tax=Cochliobolus sativus TaxID=45130 RepID=A0A8H6DS12_COCSA|nr:hypothetical protein GGP41_008386 [Bipolaris sorokiniana]
MQNEQDITMGLYKPMLNLEPSNAPLRPLTRMRRTLRDESPFPPYGIEPLATPTPVQEFRKARLLNIRIFKKGLHEEYTQ